jgi:hypothetical protein
MSPDILAETPVPRHVVGYLPHVRLIFGIDKKALNMGFRTCCEVTELAALLCIAIRGQKHKHLLLRGESGTIFFQQDRSLTNKTERGLKP